MADFLPPDFWSSGLTQPSIPFNDNFLRFHISQTDVDNSTTAEPGSPSNGDTYIMQSTHTGTSWATFAEDDLAIFWDGTWYNYTPTEGNRVSIGTSSYIYSGGAWQAAAAIANRSPAIQSVVSAATVTPTFSDDIVIITAQAAGLTLANPTGTAIPGLGMVIRIKDNGTARSIAYGAQYRAIGVTLPTTTVISKTLYLCMIYNATDTRWDVLAVGQEA